MKKIYKVKVNGKTYKVELQGIDEVATKDAPVTDAKTAKTTIIANNETSNASVIPKLSVG